MAGASPRRGDRAGSTDQLFSQPHVPVVSPAPREKGWGHLPNSWDLFPQTEKATGLMFCFSKQSFCSLR